MDYRNFVSGQKTLLIAPAGYGKTYTIVECLKHTKGKQLILTHTHAGIYSIKEKLKSSNIPPSSCRIETISSFAQKYVHAFYVGKEMPDQDDSKNYHLFLIDHAIEIFKSSLVQDIIVNSYSGLFVDEYQDCTKKQHDMILELSKILPTHILGDPLQGIFDFNGEAVDFSKDLAAFEVFPELTIPYRWQKEENNSYLGEIVKQFRENLQKGIPITLNTNDENGFHVIKVEPGDFRRKDSRYRRCIAELLASHQGVPKFNSVLFIVPEHEEIKQNGDKVPKGDIKHRAKIRAEIDYSKSLRLLEAIDDRAFYSVAKKSDALISSIGAARKKTNRIVKDILTPLFNASLKQWFSGDNLVSKTNSADKLKSEVIKNRLDIFCKNPSALNLFEIVSEVKNTLKVKYRREELLLGYLNALKDSNRNKISITEAMCNNRNTIRRSGRKVEGKCIGTVRLTKGLEFDTVAILDAHKFECRKQLYVAVSRCCKRLIIFTEQSSLSPYST